MTEDKIYNKTVSSRIFLPVQRFMHQEKSGGIVLGISVIIALILANTSLSGGYFHFFEQKFGFCYNGAEYLNFTLHHWINDGLMSLFFFVVGLELKREFIGGELAHIRNTLLPVGAAIGGMILPAVIFLLFNAGTPEVGGWGIPMATDIAFSLGVLYLLGNKIPMSVKVFLTTLAIVDDLGAVIVIAFFYTSHISFYSLGIGFAYLALLFLANKLGVKNVIFYALVGVGGVWIAFLVSGVHATIAAVLVAFTIPADATIPESSYIRRLKRLLKAFEETPANDVSTLEKEQVDILSHILTTSKDAMPPLQRLEKRLHPFVAFVIMPIFAIANAGITFTGIQLSDLFSTHVTLGVFLGLLIGKPLGIFVVCLLLIKLKIAKLPKGLCRLRMVGIGFLASIGFTMSMFVSTLAFRDPSYLIQAKVGIFLASIAGGVAGLLLLKKSVKSAPSSAEQ